MQIYFQLFNILQFVFVSFWIVDMAEGGEPLTGVDQEPGTKPKKGHGRGLSKTNTFLIDPGLKQPGYKVISNQ